MGEPTNMDELPEDVEVDTAPAPDTHAHDHIAEDPDDNAGDADAAGDGSACVEEKFIEYEDHEDPPGATSEKSSQTLLPEPEPKPKPKPTVLGMPIGDLVRVRLPLSAQHLILPIRREFYEMHATLSDTFATKIHTTGHPK